MALALVLRSTEFTEFYDGLTPTVYVSPSGALGSGSGLSEANATTWADALANAAAGDIVGVLPGISTRPNMLERWTPAFKFVNNGSSGNPIIAVGKYDHLIYGDNPTYRCELRTSGYGSIGTNNTCAIIGADESQSYIQWRNFYYDETYCPPFPSGGSMVASNLSSNIRFRKIVVDKINIPNGSDNYNEVFGQNSPNLHIDYCWFRGGNGVSHQNGCCGEFYYCDNILIEHNTVDTCVGGFFLKGATTGPLRYNSGTVRYNKIMDCATGGIFVASCDPTDGLDIYQNLIVRCPSGLWYDNSLTPVTYTVQSMRYYQNTIVDCTNNGFYVENFTGTFNSHIWRDNLVAFTASTGAEAIDMTGSMTEAGWTTLDYNQYWESGQTVQFFRAGVNVSGLAAWQTATGAEANSDEGTPSFTNAAAGDYTRTDGDTGSSTGGARGCYITGNETVGNGVS